MTKKKKALVNSVIIALIIIVPQLLLNYLASIAESNAVQLLIYAVRLVTNAVLFSAFILVCHNNKVLVERPLFDASLPFIRRYNIDRLILLFVVFLAFSVVNSIFSVIAYMFWPELDLVYALSGVSNSLLWLVAYIVTVGKGDNIFKSNYKGIAIVLIILLTIAATIANVKHITMMHNLHLQGGNIHSFEELAEMSTFMNRFNVVMDAARVCIFVALHTLLVTEDESLSPLTEENSVTE